MQFESVYTNSSWERLWIQLWSLWQKFHQSLQFGNMYTNSSWITQNTGQKLKITAVYENKNSIVINVANILVEDAIWKYLYKMFMKFIQELNCEHWQIFHQSIQFVVNLWQNQNSEAQRNYDCDSCGKSST